MRPTTVVTKDGRRVLRVLERAGFTKRPLAARKAERRRRNRIAREARKRNRA